MCSAHVHIWWPKSFMCARIWPSFQHPPYEQCKHMKGLCKIRPHVPHVGDWSWASKIRRNSVSISHLQLERPEQVSTPGGMCGIVLTGFKAGEEYTTRNECSTPFSVLLLARAHQKTLRLQMHSKQLQICISWASTAVQLRQRKPRLYVDMALVPKSVMMSLRRSQLAYFCTRSRATVTEGIRRERADAWPSP